MHNMNRQKYTQQHASHSNTSRSAFFVAVIHSPISVSPTLTYLYTCPFKVARKSWLNKTLSQVGTVWGWVSTGANTVQTTSDTTNNTQKPKSQWKLLQILHQCFWFWFALTKTKKMKNNYFKVNFIAKNVFFNIWKMWHSLKANTSLDYLDSKQNNTKNCTFDIRSKSVQHDT